MTILVYTINNTHNIKIWSKTSEFCHVQEFKDGDKSKRAMAKIKYYNNRAYITCMGHRYYLDEFKEVEF